MRGVVIGNPRADEIDMIWGLKAFRALQQWVNTIEICGSIIPVIDFIRELALVEFGNDQIVVRHVLNGAFCGKIHVWGTDQPFRRRTLD